MVIEADWRARMSGAESHTSRKVASETRGTDGVEGVLGVVAFAVVVSLRRRACPLGLSEQNTT